METINLVVKNSRIQPIAAVLLGLFLVPFGLWNLYSFFNYGYKPVPLLFGSVMLIGFGLVFWLFMLGYLRSVKYFSDDGLVRNDGKRFAWKDLVCVVDKMHVRQNTNHRLLWRTEIRFKDGSSAWLLPLKVANFAEVRVYVDSLRCEHFEE